MSIFPSIKKYGWLNSNPGTICYLGKIKACTSAQFVIFFFFAKLMAFVLPTSKILVSRLLPPRVQYLGVNLVNFSLKSTLIIQ